jgi:hypothetical protein
MEVRCKFVNTLALLKHRVINFLLWGKATVATKCHNLIDLL